MAASLGGSVATKRHRGEYRPRCPSTISAVSFRDYFSAQASKYSKLTAKELLAETKLFLGCMYERKRLWMNTQNFPSIIILITDRPI